MIKPLAAIDILHSDFESSTTIDNPWSGVTSTNLLMVRPGNQPAVNNTGAITWTVFGPSVAVGDLNGDGLPDLVIGDAHGFVWYFPNSGTRAAPKFTQGEIIPIFFGAIKGDPGYTLSAGGGENSVLRVQLISLGTSHLLDLVVGNYEGELFYVRNTGSVTNPVFKNSPSRLADSLVKTRKDGLLWCNFLCPFLYDWWGTGNLDLIMGDGSYAANSIFLFKNQSTRDAPIFNDAAMTKIIPGMGREHLTPQVIDWNNDGKPDIIAGERTGHINLFLNTSADAKQPVPTFDDGQYVKFGVSDTFGQLTTATVCDLTGNKLPNLIVTNNSGAISYAKNTGTLGSPQFGTPVPIAGVNTFPTILKPTTYNLRSPYGVANELLVCTNATVQPGFTPPPETTFKNALRYYVYPVANKYFPEFYYPLEDELFDDTHSIFCGSNFPTKENTDYHISFWYRTSGNVNNLTWHLRGNRSEPGEDDQQFDAGHHIGSATAWEQFQDTMSYTFRTQVKADARFETGQGFLELRWNGQGEIYLDDVLITSDK